MKSSRKIEITIQTDQRVVIRGSVATRNWCHKCGAEIETVSLETARILAEAITPGIEDPLLWVDLHILPVGDGGHRLCLRSLLTMVRGRNGVASSGLSGT